MINANLPVEVLEELAADQRRRLHDTVTDLRSTLQENLDVRRQAREYLLPASGTAVLLGLVLGYGLAGILTD
jgi:hypothetical protein